MQLLELRVKCWSKGWDAHEMQQTPNLAKAIDFVLHFLKVGQ